MAFNPAPTQLFAGVSENGTDITLPLAAIAQVTAAEADAVTGDLRKVAFGLCERMYQWYAALASGDRPTKMTVQRSTTPSGDGLIQTYTIQFTNSIVSQDVAAEV